MIWEYLPLEPLPLLRTTTTGMPTTTLTKNGKRDSELHMIRETTPFREKYLAPDIVLIDDIQFLASKLRTQDALFHIFEDLLQKYYKQ